jgi:hypothetical protein
MIQSFDKFNRYEIPPMILCQPNKEELFALGELSDRELKLRFNGLSEFSFTAKSKTQSLINNNLVTIDVPYFSYLDYRRIVYIKDIAYFMIVDVQEDSDGFSDIKRINCKSLEVELDTKKISLFKGTFPLYDLIEPEKSLLGTLLAYAPGWTIAEIDTELTTIYRTFDETDTSIYALLMNKVSQTYNCIFSFNTINKTITVHTVANATTPTDIYLSYDNLLENTNLKTITSELVTALNVLGSEPLSVRTVNPLGTDTIYDFSYYKNTNWMSGSLITAVTDWEDAVTLAQPTYANLLADLKNQNSILVTQKSELATLEGELTALETLRTVKIRQGLDLTVITPQINAKNSEISSKKTQILATQRAISHWGGILTNEEGIQYYSTPGLQEQLAEINRVVSFANNFTATEFAELSSFIIGSTYTNTNFVQTDSMSGSAIQEQSQQLYDQAVEVLAKVSEPRYTFEINSVNFVLLKEFQTFITQLVLGAVITINMKDNIYTYPAILGIDLDYDNPDQFKLILSNRLRLDDAAFQFSDLFQQSLSSGLTTDFNSEIWKNFQDNYRNDVSDFIKNALDASAKSIVDAKNQSFVIDGNGIRGRYLPDPSTDVFDPEQIGIINNMIVFTDNNWASARTALGKVYTTSGSASTWGLVAESIYGNLFVGNRLYIQNDNNTFSVNGLGATLTNATFTLFGNSNKNKILLDPITGIEISKKNSGGTYDKKFYVDAEGNIIFTGTLSGANGNFTGTITANSGRIGMWDIDDKGLSDITHGNYIYGDGTAKIGALTINGSEAWFHGQFYAENLNPDTKFQAHQIGSLNANVINAGTLRAIDIYGCNIYWPGVHMYSPFPNDARIVAPNGTISIDHNNNSIAVGEGFILETVQDGGAITLDAMGGGIVNLMGSIQTRDIDNNLGWAKTQNVTVTTPLGNQTLNFVNGLLVDASHYIISGSYTSGSGTGGGSSPDGTITSFSYVEYNGVLWRYGTPTYLTDSNVGITTYYPDTGIITLPPMYAVGGVNGAQNHFVFRIGATDLCEGNPVVDAEYTGVPTECVFFGTDLDGNSGHLYGTLLQPSLIHGNQYTYGTTTLYGFSGSAIGPEGNNFIATSGSYSRIEATTGSYTPSSGNIDRYFDMFFINDYILTSSTLQLYSLKWRPKSGNPDVIIHKWKN